MKIHHSIPFITIFLILTIHLHLNYAFSIFVYQGVNKADEKLQMTINGCTALPTAWRKVIKSLDTNGSCVDLWDGNYCQGKALRINNREFEHDLSLSNFSELTQSFTPCTKDLYCSKKNQAQEIKASNVSLFTDFNFKGEMLSLEVKGCVPVPKFGKLVSMSVSDGGCIEMHANSNCTHDVRTHIINRNYTCRYCDGLNMAIRSITPCQYHCFRGNSTVILRKRNNTLTIFEKIDYNGYSLDIRVKNCTHIPQIWIRMESVDPHGNCFDLYELKNCNGSWIRVTEPSNLPRPYSSIHSVGPCSLNTNIRNILSGKTSTIAIVIGVVTCLVVTSCLLVVVFYIRKYVLARQHLVEKITKEDIEWFRNGNPEATSLLESGNVNDKAANASFDHKYEIRKEDFEIEKNGILGSGQFGIVYRGIVHKKDDRAKKQTVAIKTITQVDVPYIKSLLNEIKVMIYVGPHERILELIGCCIENLENNELYLIVGFCTNGSLEGYLRNNQRKFKFETGNQYTNDPCQLTYKNIELETKITDKSLLQWAYEIGQGMEFLASKRIIHGDLATRNVLLDDNLTAKISDFGLSRQLYQYKQYTKKQKQQLPWRWLALESLRQMEFSEKSDVWSYGITLWEIFTLGDVPYPGLNWTAEFVDYLRDGFRLPCPRYTNPIMYNKVLLECWREDPESRPTFEEITEALHHFIKPEDI